MCETERKRKRETDLRKIDKERARKQERKKIKWLRKCKRKSIRGETKEGKTRGAWKITHLGEEKQDEIEENNLRLNIKEGNKRIVAVQ